MLAILAILTATRASLVDQPSSVCLDPQGCRSLGNIIWSCAVTLFLCTWVSVHPNIPSPDETWLQVTMRRLGLMIAALLIPEAMIALALRQRLAADELAEKYKGEFQYLKSPGWTITHGFFAIMGGFMVYEGDDPIRVLLPDQLNSYSLTGDDDFPRITKEEIDDKSKANAISKGLVVLQTSWFSIQCVVRGVQGLAVTKLELVTVAFATLNFVMYFLWRHKPLNVQRGVRVYRKRGAAPTTEYDLPATISLGQSHVTGVITVWLNRFTGTGDTSKDFVDRVLYKSLLLIFGGHDEDSDVKRVPTFYPDEWVTTRRRFTVFIMIAVVLAFGGIHCVGWSFTFLSNAERILWRLASVLIIVIPFPLLMVQFVFKRVFVDEDQIMLGLVGNHIMFRLVLLVLSLLSLRSLPPLAYHVLDWTSPIPHV
ncbi:hypothetical protein F5148DRAFT_980654 [Russula earlei]|uniref:Uncharacterized protein n=1 Tax=Russula earlei TaxID=71964 RepID=A0ACC0UA65_9AGAM|nr:hypothetical protein F5148DRAFT_980654 [Russula earlei]